MFVITGRAIKKTEALARKFAELDKQAGVSVKILSEDEQVDLFTIIEMYQRDKLFSEFMSIQLLIFSGCSAFHKLDIIAKLIRTQQEVLHKEIK